MRSSILIAAPFAILACAGSGASMPEPGTPLDADNLDVRREQAAQPFAVYSGFSDSARVAVRTQSQWNEIWARVAGNATPPPEAPEIDFATEMVIVAAMGTRPTGGFAIRIDRVARRANTVWVEVTSSSPGSGCMTSASLTAPVDLVVTQKTTGKVVFVERSEVRNC
ncbi:MAG: protease complex subunit PrcB family protein [Gemmatimonadaceae bacterium]|nr:protease complex subunit PrcB family protein [Gemmatimonadaceae bacterium]NUQ92114.1 protease complex subunit PrcB family protein [Gemmatimonadaceae bacterium]NUR18183.1 protease complex subunit PrcB family protein [Gemmatimonadaceae bacterium]NUS97790.1 protease complex subunit PrcB family protein [Gemmatimonadaceae bacterium]